MRRTIAWLLSIMLAAATGAALSGTVSVLTAPIVEGQGAAVNTAIGRAFYDTVNAVIETGDVALIDAVLAPEMVEHTPAPGLPSTRDGLVRYLLSLHATVPAMRLVPEEVFASGDYVMVRVRTEAMGSGDFLGTRVGSDVAAWGSLDQFRITDGRIVEHWGSAAQQVLLEPLPRVTLDAGFLPRNVVGMERVRYAPGARQETEVAYESRLIYLKSGTLAVMVDEQSRGRALLVPAAGRGYAVRPDTVVPGARLTLAPGDLLALPATARSVIQNEGDQPAEALVLTGLTSSGATPRSDPAYLSFSSGSPDVSSVTSVAGYIETELPAGRATVGFGRATLVPGATVTFYEAAGPSLLVVEAGTLSVEVADGTAWVRRGTYGTSTSMAEGTLTAGDGALLQPGSPIEFGNRGDTPVVVLVVAIRSDGAGA